MSNPFVNNSFNDNVEVDVRQPTEETNSATNGSQPGSKHNSWVQFEENAGGGDANVNSTDRDKEAEMNGAIRMEALDNKKSSAPDNGNKRISSISASNETSNPPNESSTNNYAVIELSNSIEISHPQNVIVQQPGSSGLSVSSTTNNSKTSSGSVVVPSTIASTLASAPIVASSNNVSSSAASHFANGDLIVNLLPLNDGCDWITPAKFKAHLVPEELMAQSLTLTVEEYVSSMSMLFNDYRFNFYIIFYKRVLGLWISLGVLILLCILFSGWKGLTLFIAGMLWLILNALGIFAAIYVKQKLYRMLEQCIAQVNAVFMKHNIFVGVDDRGRYSCHKVNLVFVYFDTKYCVKFLQDMLTNSEQQVISSRLNNNQIDNQAVITLNNTLSSIDTTDIIITGSTRRNISQKEKYAEKLLLRYSQRWIREFHRERMDLNVTPPPATTASATSAATGPSVVMNNHQPHPAARKPGESAVTAIPMSPRHCRNSKCFCQYIEEHLKYKPLTSLTAICGFGTELF